MGFLNKMIANWKAKTTTEKISFVLEAIAKIGGGMIGAAKGREWSEGRGRLSSACIRITATGLGAAAGDIASQYLTKEWAKPIGKALDDCKAKIEEENKEEQANG